MCKFGFFACPKRHIAVVLHHSTLLSYGFYLLFVLEVYYISIPMSLWIICGSRRFTACNFYQGATIGNVQHILSWCGVFALHCRNLRVQCQNSHCASYPTHFLAESVRC